MPTYFSCTLLLFLFCFSSFSDNHLKDEIKFRDLSFTTAKSEAAWQHKKIFVYCSAHYCTACKIMEEYTFTDPALNEYINAEFLPVKVDIHSALGKEWVNEFNISAVPTFLVFDESGYLLQRLETTYTGSSLLALLQGNKSARLDAAATKTQLDTIPKDPTTIATKPLLAEQGSVTLLSDTLKTKEVASAAAENERIVAAMIPKEQRNPSAKTAIEKIIPVKKLLINGTYKIQMGQFTEYDKAAAIAKQLQSHFHKEVFLMIDAKGHYKTYSLLVQGFADQQEAGDFLLDLGEMDLAW